MVGNERRRSLYVKSQFRESLEKKSFNKELFLGDFKEMRKNMTSKSA